MPRVYHFDLAYAKWSGGDNCTFETIRYFSFKPVENFHITTEKCRAIYENKGLSEGLNLRFLTVPDYCEKTFGLPLFFAFFRRIRAAKLILNAIDWRDDDVIILHNEFFVNTIPALIPARKNKRCRMLYWIHMICPDLFKGFEGQFTGTFHFPGPAFIHYWISQRLCAKLMSPAGRIISHNPYYAELLPKLFPKCDFDLIYPYSGVDPAFRIPSPEKEFEYDFVWLGRFHAQKGLFDVIEAIALIKEKTPNVRLALIGGGSNEMEQKVHNQIRKRNLENNIILLGPLYDAEKYTALRKGKIYLMTSHFEGYCNVMVEALTMGVPVIAYDAPFHRVFQQGVEKVPMQDTITLAEKASALLEDEPLRLKMASEAFNTGNKHTWNQVSEKTYNMACSQEV